MKEQDTVWQRFRMFKETFVSSNVPNDILLDLIESFLASDDNSMTITDEPALEGQISFFDTAV